MERDPEPQPPSPETGPDWMPPQFVAGYLGYLQQYTHNLNLLRWFLGGDPTNCRVRTVDLRDGYSGIVSLEMNGVQAVIESGSLSYWGWEEHTQVYFRDGWVRVDAPALLHKDQPAAVEIYRGGKRAAVRAPPRPAALELELSARGGALHRTRPLRPAVPLQRRGYAGGRAAVRGDLPGASTGTTSAVTGSNLSSSDPHPYLQLSAPSHHQFVRQRYLFRCLRRRRKLRTLRERGGHERSRLLGERPEGWDIRALRPRLVSGRADGQPARLLAGEG